MPKHFRISSMAICLFLFPVLFLVFQCTTAENTDISQEPPVTQDILFESRERADIPDSGSPAGLRVVQITTNPELKSWNVYTEARVFTPDSKMFVFVREGSLWLCDIGNNFALRRLTDEEGVKGPSVGIDGKWLYYLVDRTELPEGTLTLKKVSLDDFSRHTVLVIDGTIPGSNSRPTKIYSLTSISSDGERLCTSCFLGDGKTENATWGLIVFNLRKPSVTLVFQDTHFNNMHPQYCLSENPEESHDVLLQHNHNSEYDIEGNTLKLVGGAGADLHVIRDDGTEWRDIPIGRDGKEYVQGHQQWRGRMSSVLSAMSFPNGRKRILEGFPISTDKISSHAGFKIAGGKYFDITRNIDDPQFWHFSSDLSGMYIVSDTYTVHRELGTKDIHLVIGTLSGTDNPEIKLKYLLNTGTSGEGQSAHPHPFFSPDAKMAFFNSDREGVPQVWMVTGYDFPEF